MNRTLKFALSSIAFGAAALGLLAQEPPALKIVTVDMAKIYENHYETQAQNAKLRDAQQKAEEQLQDMVKEDNQMVEQYKEAVDRSNNTLLTQDARDKAKTDSESLMQKIQQHRVDMQNFRNSTLQSLQQRIANFRNLLMDQISKKVTEIAKTKGATLVVDTSGPSGIGVPPVIYSDPAYDITDLVMAEINKERPPAPAATPSTAAAPAATPSAPAPASTENPSVTVPGLSPGK